MCVILAITLIIAGFVSKNLEDMIFGFVVLGIEGFSIYKLGVVSEDFLHNIELKAELQEELEQEKIRIEELERDIKRRIK